MPKYISLFEGQHTEESRIVDINDIELVKFYRDEDDRGYVVGDDAVAYSIIYYFATGTIAYTHDDNVDACEIDEEKYKHFASGFLEYNNGNFTYEYLTKEHEENWQWEELDEYYTVCDKESIDRKHPEIDTFLTLEEAIQFAKEWANDYGFCTIQNAEGDTLMYVDAEISFDKTKVPAQENQTFRYIR